MQLEKFVVPSRNDARLRRLQAVLFVVLAVGLSVLAHVMRTSQPSSDRGTLALVWGASLVIGLLAGGFLARQELARVAAGGKVNRLATAGAFLVFFLILPRLGAGLRAGGLGLLAGAVLGAAAAQFLFLAMPREDDA